MNFLVKSVLSITSPRLSKTIFLTMSWVRPWQGWFSPGARRDHSRAGWPHLAKQNRVFHTMCCNAGVWLGGAAEAGRESWLWSTWRVVRVVLCVLLFCFVYPPYLYHCCSCSLCCSVKLPLSRPTSFCLFLSILLRTLVGGGTARRLSGPFV